MTEPIPYFVFAPLTVIGAIVSIVIVFVTVSRRLERVPFSRQEFAIAPFALLAWLWLPWAAWCMINLWSAMSFDWIPFAPHDPNEIITRFDPRWQGPEK